MSEPITKTIDDVEAIGYMNTHGCSILLTDGTHLKCLGYNNDVCVCPGALPGESRGHGIWVEKQQYFELRLLGKLSDDLAN